MIQISFLSDFLSYKTRTTRESRSRWFMTWKFNINYIALWLLGLLASFMIVAFMVEQKPQHKSYSCVVSTTAFSILPRYVFTVLFALRWNSLCGGKQKIETTLYFQQQTTQLGETLAKSFELSGRTSLTLRRNCIWLSSLDWNPAQQSLTGEIV